jgi:hypothetical protein
VKIGEDLDAGKLAERFPGEVEWPVDKPADLKPPTIQRDFRDPAILQHGPFPGPGLAGRNPIRPLGIRANDHAIGNLIGARGVSGLVFVDVARRHSASFDSMQEACNANPRNYLRRKTGVQTGVFGTKHNVVSSVATSC